MQNNRFYNREDAAFSKATFQKVWDTGILQRSGFVRFDNVEGTTEDFVAGTDYHFFDAVGRTVRVGFRAQHDVDFRTFTIRAGQRAESISFHRTEWDHLVDGSGPDFLLHAYLNGDELRFAMAEAKTIVALEAYHQINSSNATFRVLHWMTIRLVLPEAILWTDSRTDSWLRRLRLLPRSTHATNLSR